MGFLVNRDCKCCREMIWHCAKCWDDFHNGRTQNDYIPPEYYGQPMLKDEEEMFKQHPILKEVTRELNRTIIADKNRKYKEGEYH
jgi:hypothetical protein